MGVRLVDDLADVYPDASLLEEVRQNVSPLDFKKFLRACDLTTVLRDVSLPDEYATLLNQQATVPAALSKISGLSLADPERDAQRRLVEVQATLDALLAAQNEEVEVVVLTETKIQAIQDRINQIQSGGLVSQKAAAAHSDKAKRENVLQLRLDETVRRKHLIDGRRQFFIPLTLLSLCFQLYTTRCEQRPLWTWPSFWTPPGR